MTTSGPSRRILAVLLVEFLLIVGGLTTATVFAANSGPHSGLTARVFFWQTQASSDAPDKANAVSVARQFVLNSDAFTPANLKSYLANLMPLLTTKAQASLTSEYASFEQAAGSILSQLTKSSQIAAMASSGNIEFAALSTFGNDAATVLVAHDVLYGGVQPQQCVSKPTACQSKRWSVSLRKVNGAWLVDTFNPNA